MLEENKDVVSILFKNKWVKGLTTVVAVKQIIKNRSITRA